MARNSLTAFGFATPIAPDLPPSRLKKTVVKLKYPKEQTVQENGLLLLFQGECLIMVTKRFETWPLDEIIPYENNPRINDEAVADVMESIRQCENLDPIEVDEDGVILSGHTRLKALKKLKYKETDVVVYEGLTDEQKRKYRLLANKTGEKALWDLDKLDEELEGLDFEGFDFGFNINEPVENLTEEDMASRYASGAKIPQYEPKGEMPEIVDLVDENKSKELIEEIENANIPEDVKRFLKVAAYRHNVFNYRNIAEYYAHSASEVQRLMEKSALVIIDINDAIANGYVKLSKTIQDIIDEDEDDE